MRIYKAIIFIICLSFGVTSEGQSYQQLLKADSLAIANDFVTSTKLINDVLNSRPRNFLKSQAFYQLSYNYLQLFDLEKAYDYNEQSLKIRKQLQYEFIADNYMRFGTIELLKNNLQTALDYFLDAKDLPHANLKFSGILDGYLGATYDRLGQSTLALKYYNNSLEILTDVFGENHPDVSVAHYNLGTYYAAQNNNLKAIEHYEKAILIELNSATGAESNPRLAKAYNALGILTYQQEADLKKASLLFDAALIASQTYSRLTASTLVNLAQVDFMNKKYEDSKEKLLIAERALDHSIDEEDPRNFIPLILDKPLFVSLLQTRTQVFLEEYFFSKDIKKLEGAFESSRLAVSVFEGQLLDYYDEKSQLELLENSMDIYEQAIYVASKLYELTEDQNHLDEAFKIAEQGKAIVLKNQMQQFFEMLGNDLPENLKKEEQRIRSQLAFFETDLAVKYNADNFRTAALSLNRAYKKLLQDIEKSAPQYYDLRYQTPSVSIKVVQQNLQPDEALVSYYQGKEWYYIFAINKEKAMSYRSLQNAPLATKTELALKDLEKRSKAQFPLPNQTTKGSGIPQFPKPDVGIYTQYTEHDIDLKTGVNRGLSGMIKLSKGQFINANYSLYQRLISPIKPILKRKKKLIVIPHGDLHYVTFETLLKEKPKKKIKYNKLKYLIKYYSVSYLFSADFFINRKETKAKEGNSLAAFAPVFNPEDNIGYTIDAAEIVFDSTNINEIGLRSAIPDQNSFKMLEHSENEVVSILKLFAKKDKNAKAYLKDNASENQFKKEAGNYDFLHLASHSFVNAVRPKLSGVALSPSDTEDGILFAGEVMNMDLRNTKLLVLSSCESGTGDLIRGEGLLSLNRAFQFAGVKNTISTRWKVSDKASAKLMVYFYKYLLSGDSYAEALQAAKIKMIKRSKTAIPKLWAGYTLTGG